MQSYKFYMLDWFHSALRVYKEVMGSNPARVTCEVFSTVTRKAPSMQCYTHVGVGQD